MRRDTANVLLVLLGGVLIKIALDGTALRYVRPSMLPWLVVAGGVIVGLAALALVRDLRAVIAERHSDEHGGRSGWLLTLPVLALILLAPPALGVASVSLSDGLSSAGAEPRSDFTPQAEGPTPIRVADLVQYAVWDDSGSLDGRPIAVTGFLVAREGGVDLARVTISCCAADARPVRIRLAGAVPDAPEGSWVTAVGTVVPGSATKASEFSPTLTVTSSTPTSEPAEPYEY